MSGIWWITVAPVAVTAPEGGGGPSWLWLEIAGLVLVAVAIGVVLAGWTVARTRLRNLLDLVATALWWLWKNKGRVFLVAVIALGLVALLEQVSGTRFGRYDRAGLYVLAFAGVAVAWALASAETLGSALGGAAGWVVGAGGTVLRFVLPLIGVAMLVGGFWLLAREAKKSTNADLWGPVLAAVLLAEALLLVFSTGKRRATALEPIEDGWVAEKEIPKDESLRPEDLERARRQGSEDKLERVSLETWKAKDAFKLVAGPHRVYAPGETIRDAEVVKRHESQVKQQRGVFFRLLYTGKDGRWSTSKMQALLWTLAILYGFLVLAILDLLPEAEPRTTPDDWTDLPFEAEYLVLAGGPLAAAVTAKALTVRNVQQGFETKTETTEGGGTDGLAELISDDKGDTDLGDFQYAAFNLFLLVWFLVTFLSTLSKGFPDLPDLLVAMSGASALAYVTKKAIATGTPTVTSVIPSRLVPGEEFEVIGTNLLASPDKLPTIKVGGVVADGVQRVANADRSIDRLKAIAPPGKAGDSDVVVVTETGTETAAKAVTVAGMTIAGVNPKPLVIRKDAQVTIDGTGFATRHADAFVTLGQKPLEIGPWTDTKIVAALVATEVEAQGYPVGKDIALIVGNGGTVQATFPIETATLDIEGFDPTSPKKGTTPFAILGKGFGVEPKDGETHVWLDDEPLDWTSWIDTRIAVALPLGAEAGNATVRVKNADGYEAVRAITIAPP